MGLNFRILQISPELFTWHYMQKPCGPDWTFCGCFFSWKHCAQLWRRYDVRKFTVHAILFREIQCKKMDISMFELRFQCEFGWNKVKYAWITIAHFCFIALTLAGSLGWCLNTRPISLMFKHLPLDPANGNAWKNMCVIPILKPTHTYRWCLPGFECGSTQTMQVDSWLDLAQLGGTQQSTSVLRNPWTGKAIPKPFQTNGLFHKVWYSKVRKIHCIYWGVRGYNFQENIVFFLLWKSILSNL